MLYSEVIAKNVASKIRQLLHWKNGTERCIIVSLEYSSRDIFNEWSDMEQFVSQVNVLSVQT